MSDYEMDFDVSMDAETVVIQAGIPVGKYHVQIDSVEWKKSNSGSPFLSLALHVVDEELNGRKLFDSIFWTPKCIQFSKEKIKKLAMSAFGKEIGGKLKLADADAYQVFKGKVVHISVKHEEYQGEMQAKVGQYLPNDDSYVEANNSASSETFVVDEPVTPRGGSEDADCPF